MILSTITKQHIEAKLGKCLRYPSDFEQLAYDIERTTKQRISTNTLKRLLGSIESVREPRLFTLDVVAQYLGYANWDIYIMSMSKDGISEHQSMDTIETHILNEVTVKDLSIGTKVEFHYYPDRKIVLEYRDNNKFKVVGSTNSKLKIDDIVEVNNFQLNYPLIINCVFRNGVNVGRFTAGKISGLTFLKIL